MPVDKLTLTLETKTIGDEAVQKLIDNLNKVGVASENAGKKTDSAFAGFGEKIKAALEDPLGQASEALEKVAEGLGSVGAVATAAVGGIAAIGAAGFEAVKSLGELGQQIANVSLRTGLSTKEVGQFSFAAKSAGGDVSLFETAMRRLSQGLTENSDEGKKAKEGLFALGVQARDASGNLRPTSEIFLQISDGLNKMENAADRNAAAIKIFGRAGVELIPTMRELRENIERARELGLGISDQDIKRFEIYDHQIIEIEESWARLSRAMKEPLAAVISFALNPSKSGLASIAGIVDPFEYAASRTDYTDVFGAGATQSRSVHRRLVQPLVQGNALLDRLEAQQAKTPGGIRSAYERAKGAASDAWSALEATRGQGIDAVQKAADNWRKASAEADRYGAMVDSLNAKVEKHAQSLAEILGLWKSQAEEGKLERENMWWMGGAKGLPAGSGTLFAPGRDLSRAPVEGGTPYFVNPSLSAGAAPLDQARIDQQSLDFQIRKTQLMSGPGGEADAIRTVTQMKLDALQKERDTFTDVTDYELKKNQILFDQTEQLLNLRTKDVEQWRSSVVSAFDALVSGGSGGLSAFFKSQGLGVLRRVVGNLSEELYKPGRLSITNNPNSTLGRLLRGTPFGADPAGGVQLSAAQIQLQAAQMQLSAAAHGVFGGGSPASVAGALSGFPFPSGSGSGNAFSDAGIPSAGDGWYGWGDTGTGMANVAASSGMTWGRGIGIAGAAIGGAYGVYSGIHSGGVRGAMMASGSLAGSTGAILGLAGVSGPAAPILAGVGLALGLVTALFGNPKQKRAEQLQNETQSRRSTEPLPQDYYSDMSGMAADYNYRGGVRTYRAPVVVINAPISAIDAPTFGDWSKRNSPQFADAVLHAVSGGNAEALVSTLRQVM